MIHDDSTLEIRLAENDADICAAKRLRYRVFVEELGATGELNDPDRRLEQDRFDPFCQHLVLIDKTRDPVAGDHVVGVYRMMDHDGADRAGGFYSETEYDLSRLITGGRSLLELGRSCVDKDFRGGPAMFYLWNGLARYIAENKVEILFGVASFHGTDVVDFAEPLSFLHHRYLAPADLRVRAQPDHYQSLDLMPADEVSRERAMRQTPALIKAYLRLGGCVGDGAFVDHQFNTIDVCMLMDTAQLTERQKRRYQGGLG